MSFKIIKNAQIDRELKRTMMTYLASASRNTIMHATAFDRPMINEDKIAVNKSFFMMTLFTFIRRTGSIEKVLINNGIKTMRYAIMFTDVNDASLPRA